MAAPARVLVVDDSPTMRGLITAVLSQDPDVSVIGQAGDAMEARAAIKQLNPDVVTLDINMPELDGLSALAEMMLQRPVPVIMLSSLTAQGALATFEALALGAVDYVAKPGGTISLGIDALRAELVAKVRGAAKAKVRGPDGAPTATSTRTAGRTVARPAEPAEPACASTVPLDARQPGVVVIGVSTGGPRTLERILPQLPAHFPWPVVVAQHMPTSFTAPFAERLGRLCALRVVEAAQPMPLAAGTVYVCKGGADKPPAAKAAAKAAVKATKPTAKATAQRPARSAAPAKSAAKAAAKTATRAPAKSAAKAPANKPRAALPKVVVGAPTAKKVAAKKPAAKSAAKPAAKAAAPAKAASRQASAKPAAGKSRA